VKLRHRGTTELLTADTAAGNSGDVIQYSDFGGTEEKWEPRLVGMTEATYRIIPRQAQVMALGGRNHNSFTGTQLEQQAWDGGAWQRWTMQSVGSGQFRIFPENQSTQTLAIAGGATADGAKAVLVPWTGAAEQKWTFTATDNGWVRLTPAHAAASCLQIN